MSQIEVIALRSFPWSEDGYTELHAVEKSTFMLPENLFDGLNKAGYVRRATIGDGHIDLSPAAPEQSPAAAPAAEAEVVETVQVTPVAAVESATITSVDNAPAEVVGAAGVVSAPAPQPPARTAGLTDEEKSALADGSWKDWRYFKQRSVAARLSDQPILNGDDAKTAIEAYLAKE